MTLQRLGSYDIVQRIATGGMGEIYLAKDAGASGRSVVIKCVRPSGTRPLRRDLVSMLLQEARIGTMIDHPNVVKVFAVDFEDGCYFMVMEELRGWDLRQVWTAAQAADRRLPIPIVLRLIAQAADGLHAAHECRTETGSSLDLVHRDVSPSNLFISTGGRLKVLDFGVAKTSIQMRQTLTGVIKGKIAYMSPEQLRADALDRRSDIYSLGIVLHELLTGRRLFKRPNPLESSNAILHGFVPPPLRIEEPLPEALVALTMGALQRDRDLRIQTAAELSSALREIGAAAPSTEREVAETIRGLVESNAGARTTGEALVDTVALSRWATDVVDRIAIDGGATAVDRRRTGLLDPWAAIDMTVHWVQRRVSGPLAGGVRRQAPRRGVRAAIGAAVLFALLAGAWVGIADRLQPPAPPPVASATAAGPELRATPSAVHEIAEPPLPAPSPVTPVEGPIRSPPRRRSGKLTLGAKPWANVYLGAKFLGPTPLVDYLLPAGSYTFRLVIPKSGEERTVTLEIPPGGSVRHNALFH